MKNLRVMTFNIRHGRGMDNAINLERIAHVIAEAGADLVALNEVDRSTRRCGDVDQPAELARLTNMHYEYSPSIPYQGGQYGNAVLSRWPIHSATVHTLPKLGNETRTLLRTQIDCAGVNLNFMATHLGLGDEEQRAQLEAVAALLEGVDGPKILAGDFNFDAGDVDLLAVLEPMLRDARQDAAGGEGAVASGVHVGDGGGNAGAGGGNAGAGGGNAGAGGVEPVAGLTFPSDGPVKRIDYVLLSQELAVIDAFRPMVTLASDHLPVVGTVALR